MNEPKTYQAIMLSSTFTDLKEHRQRAIEAISKLGYLPKVMEHSGAGAEADVIESSLSMVRDSAAYVGVISLKYGQTPHDPDRNPDQLSITELEFNEAMRLDRPVLLFIMGDKHQITKADIELDPDKLKKLDAFRERAKRMRAGSAVERVYEMFESLEQFSTAAATAIGRLIQYLGPPTASANTDRDGAPHKALSNIPINVPLHFLGRDGALAAIDAALKGKQGRAAITTALHGLRGVGKTTLAAAYAEHGCGEYRATWWIRAETIPTMRADLVGLAVRMGWVVPNEKEEPALMAVLERLRDEGEGILLIYDNANNPNEIGPYMPHAGAAHIIVTSNAPNWSGVAVSVEIEKWPKEIGADYLIAQAGRPKERDAASALSAALDGLPLAHEQAAAYCARTGLSLADYRKRFEAEPTKFLDTERDASPGYHNRRTVAKTFTLAIDEAAKLHPAAERLVVYAALLAPEPIPLYLFSEAAQQFDKIFATAIAGDGLDEAVAALRSFALVDRESVSDERDPIVTTDCIRLHRLIRQVAAARCEGETLGEARRMLLSALMAVYPPDSFDNPRTWPRARRLDALALALVDLDSSLPEGAAIQASYLLNQLGLYRQGSLAAYDLAQPLLERALKINEKVLGSEHPVTAASLSNLAVLLRARGDVAGSRPLHERALAIREKAFGPDHPETASSLNNVGALMQAEGDLASARLFYERALAIREKALDPNHQDIARCLSNLGNLLREHGDFADARPLLERALTIREKVLGSDHPETATSLNNLSGLLWEQGDIAGAWRYIERALHISEKIVGPEHPQTRNLALGTFVVLQSLGRVDEAKAVVAKYRISDIISE